MTLDYILLNKNTEQGVIFNGELRVYPQVKDQSSLILLCLYILSNGHVMLTRSEQTGPPNGRKMCPLFLNLLILQKRALVM